MTMKKILPLMLAGMIILCSTVTAFAKGVDNKKMPVSGSYMRMVTDPDDPDPI